MSGDSGRLSYIHVEQTQDGGVTQTYHSIAVDIYLTNTKVHWIGNPATSIVADATEVAPFIGLLHTGNGQCSTIRPLCRTWLPLLTPILLPSWLPLPVEIQGFCAGGLESELYRFAWNSILSCGWVVILGGSATYM